MSCVHTGRLSQQYSGLTLPLCAVLTFLVTDRLWSRPLMTRQLKCGQHTGKSSSSLSTSTSTGSAVPSMRHTFNTIQCIILGHFDRFTLQASHYDLRQIKRITLIISKMHLFWAVPGQYLTIIIQKKEVSSSPDPNPIQYLVDVLDNKFHKWPNLASYKN